MNQDFRFSVNTEGKKAQFQLSGECTFAAPADNRIDARSGGAGDVKTAIPGKTRKKVIVNDEATAIAWLLKKHMLQCLRMPLFAVNKTEVKKILDIGANVPGVKLVECATKNDADDRQQDR